MNPVEVTRGDGPVVLGMPHTGSYVPGDVLAVLNDTGRALADTDWQIDRLYNGLLPGATIVRATFHRYVIDPNRDPSGASLYPGQNTTGLCPTTDFDGQPLYRDGCEPREAEIADRREAFHVPYHAALAAEIERVRERHGVAVLYDCHSIRSVIPFLFDGVLPDFNIGTNGGVTCDPAIERAVADVCARAKGYGAILNGRFKGGWTTRHYGKPARGVHAIQMELTQSAYLETEAAPFAYSERKGEAVRAHLREALARIDAWARDQRAGAHG
jgi:N-formylglutamate deformylase